MMMMMTERVKSWERFGLAEATSNDDDGPMIVRVVVMAMPQPYLIHPQCDHRLRVWNAAGESIRLEYPSQKCMIDYVCDTL